MTEKTGHGNLQTSVKVSSKESGVEEVSVDNIESVSIKVPAVTNPHAMVGISHGITLNLGNFQFARIDVSITVPCAVDKIDQTYSELAKDVETKLQGLTDDYQNQGG